MLHYSNKPLRCAVSNFKLRAHGEMRVASAKVMYAQVAQSRRGPNPLPWFLNAREVSVLTFTG
jgi:hypothetical protein